MKPESLHIDEKSAIKRYKDLFNMYFPWVEKIADLVVMNFDPSAYKKDTNFEGLKKYLSDLQMYISRLGQCYELRQYHFNRWIDGQKEEEKGHKYWREGLAKIVEDAKEKFAYWSEIYEQMFRKIISDFEKRPDTLSHLDLCAVNTDFRLQDNQKKNKKEKNVIIYYRRPRISEAQKKRLASARKKQKLEHDANDLAAIKHVTKTNMAAYNKEYVRIDLVSSEILENWDNLENYLVKIGYDSHDRKREVFIDALKDFNSFTNVIYSFFEDFEKVKLDDIDTGIENDVSIKFQLFISILCSNNNAVSIYLYIGYFFIKGDIHFHSTINKNSTYSSIALCMVCGLLNFNHKFLKDFEGKFTRMFGPEDKNTIINFMKISCDAYAMHPYVKEYYFAYITSTKKTVTNISQLNVKGRTVIYKGKIYGGYNIKHNPFSDK
jgi:hypothetical protein